MTESSLNSLAKKYFAYLDRRDLDGLVTLFAPNARFHGLAPQVLDRDGVKASMAAFFSAFPDSRMPYDDIITDGDRVVIRHSFRGTHQAPFQNIPATGKPVVVTAIVTLQVRDGQVTEGWLNPDILGLLQQLGAVPLPS